MTATADSLKQRLQAAMKTAMKAGDKQRLAVIRMALAAIKQREIDERITLDDDQTIAVLDKMVKQRRESVAQYRDGGRDDLADAEAAEIRVLQDFLPQPLDSDEIDTLIKHAIEETGAASARDMGKIMTILKPRMQGRADMTEVSKKVKASLGGS